MCLFLGGGGVAGAHRAQKRMSDALELEGIGGCKLPDMGAVNQTLALRKSGTCC